MKIYFAGSISGGREDQELYALIIKELQKYGQVLTEHVADKAITAFGETVLSASEIYNRDLVWLTECDVVVAEVTTISHGVGYEIGKVEGMDKAIFCLYRPSEGKRLSAMIAGNPNLIIWEYQDFTDISRYIKEYLGN
ncbi:MAG: nucleoside 2-deoxyribosyltransferase [Minisyncoccota bacterium]